MSPFYSHRAVLTPPPLRQLLYMTRKDHPSQAINVNPSAPEIDRHHQNRARQTRREAVLLPVPPSPRPSHTPDCTGTPLPTNRVIYNPRKTRDIILTSTSAGSLCFFFVFVFCFRNARVGFVSLTCSSSRRGIHRPSGGLCRH